MTRPAPIIAGTVAALVLLFGAYMGGYYAMLDGVGKVNSLSPRNSYSYPRYRHRRAWPIVDDPLLWPAHQLDRLIRPGYWGDE